MLDTLSSLLRAYFPAIWLLILMSITLIFFKASLPELKSSKISDKSIHRTLHFSALSSWSFSQFLGSIAFFIFLVVYCFLIFYKQDFANYDNDIFTDYILNGKFYGPPIWPDQGRFFPLGHQEWNLLTIISQSPPLYFALPILQCLIVVILLFFLLKEFSIWLQLSVIFLILTTPSTAYSFFSLTIPERNLIVWLIIFILAFKSYLKSSVHRLEKAVPAMTAPPQSGYTFAFGIVLIATHFALYYKEPVFILLSIFALIRLLFFARRERDLIKQNLSDFIKVHKIEFFILILCFIFVLFYILINLPHRSISYATSRSIDYQTAFLYFVESNPLLSLFLILTISRFIYLFYWRKKGDIFWDSLAIGSIGYFLFYVKIGLINNYFLAPIDLIAILYIIHVFSPILQKSWGKLLLFALGTILVIQNIYETPKIITERFNFINARVQIVQFLQNYSQQRDSDEVNLYFPYTNKQYVLYYFSCFLKYKNRQINDSLSYRLTSPLEFAENNKCVSWNSNHNCFQIKSPNLEDLIIILPEEEIQQTLLSEWQQQENLLFHYRPFPSNSPMHAYIFKKVKS